MARYTLKPENTLYSNAAAAVAPVWQPPAPFAPAQNLPVDDSWLSAVSGDWATGADWSTGTVPSVFSNVLIGQAGAYTVTVDAFSAAYALTLDAAGATLLVGGNAGTLTAGTTITVTAGALELTDSGSTTGSLATGTLTVGAAGLLEGAGIIDAYVISTGSIAISAQTLVLDGGGSLGGTLAGSGTLSLAGGAFTSTASALAGLGNLALDDAATLTLGGGGNFGSAISVNGSAALAVAASTNLTLTGDLTFGLSNGLYNGPGEIAGGTLATSGTTLINQFYDTTSEPELGVNGSWINTGTVYDLGSIEGTGTILNSAGGGFYLFDDNAGFVPVTNGTNGTLTNAGTLAKTSGTGVATVNWSVLSTGLIYVVAGDLWLQGGGTLGGAIAGLGTLSLGGNFSSTLGVLNSAGAPETNSSGDLTITGPSGTLTNSLQISGTLSAASKTDVTVASTALSAFEMTFDGPGSITLTGSYSPGYQLALGAKATFINAGTFTGAIAFAGSKTTPVAIDNLAGATMNLTGVTASNQNMDGTLSNAGTLNFNGYPGYATIGIGLNNSGQVMIGSGETVYLRGGGTLDGTFTGAGTLDLYTGKYSSTPAALSGIAAVDIGKGALLNLNGSGSTVGISNITSNPGHIVATSGSLTFLGGFQNTGNINAAGYSISFDNGVGGKGVMEVGSGGTLSLLAGSSSQQTVEFLSSNAQLALTNPLEFSGVLTDFGTGDTIDLVQQAATGFSFTNNVLTVVDGSTTVATLSFNAGYGDNSFAITPDGHGGSTISFV